MIYLDHASTTPTDPRVVKAMLAYFSDKFANPSGLYSASLEAKKAVEKARQGMADFLSCKTEEIIFCGSGTESDNLAILGVARFHKKGHLISSKIEHPAVLKACRQLEKEGFELTLLAPNREGIISAESVKKALKADTILVSIMYANNEIGTIQPIKEIGQVIHQFRQNRTLPLFHSDACQASEYLPMKVEKLGVDLLTINGAKIYGPKGIGALFIKSEVELQPLVFGGGQEGGLRSGTENVAGIVGIGAAIKLINQEKEAARLSVCRDYLIRELLKIEGAELNGSETKRLPNNVNISFSGVEGESAVLYLDREGIACSTGSACSSLSLKPSHVILAIGKDAEIAHSSLRFTLGRGTNQKDLAKAVSKIKKVVCELRNISAEL